MHTEMLRFAVTVHDAGELARLMGGSVLLTAAVVIAVGFRRQKRRRDLKGD
ncbi:hypothetical protein SAMN04489740_4336 [Arthrobacter alpinus]|uniref:Uncharacterized protein n=1 Tax=Arthrobacter alpinus TaxID=656366 RepID=A0A1H5PGS7_9MICC|nr:hypothetical protein [Arthrobacter alpinus]SEF13132.1 hypothetical protein SAMN04489740_4336 [Arthrobacter alpinus]